MGIGSVLVLHRDHEFVLIKRDDEVAVQLQFYNQNYSESHTEPDLTNISRMKGHKGSIGEIFPEINRMKSRHSLGFMTFYSSLFYAWSVIFL